MNQKLSVYPVNAVHRFTEDGIDYVRVDIKETLIDIDFVDIFANDPRIPPNLMDVPYVWIMAWKEEEGDISQKECGFARWQNTIAGLAIFMGDNLTGSLPKFSIGRRLKDEPNLTPNSTAHNSEPG